MQVIKSDKKYLMMTNGDGEFEIIRPHMSTSSNYGGTSDIISSPTLGGSDIGKTSASGRINTMPLSASSNTLSKRSSRSKRAVTGNIFIKDYIKKRNLILELLAVEIELLLVGRVCFCVIIKISLQFLHILLFSMNFLIRNF